VPGRPVAENLLLRAFVRDMLGNGGQEVDGSEYLEVAVDLGVEPGALNDQVRGGFQSHLFHREGVAQDVFLKCHLTAQVQKDEKRDPSPVPPAAAHPGDDPPRHWNRLAAQLRSFHA
jgi:hypothetical protein